MKQLFSLLLISGLILTGCSVVSPNPSPVAIVIPTATPTAETVPLPNQEDIVRLFFNLINEKRIPEAIAMMDSKMIPDDSTKQAYGVQFNAIQSIKVTEIQPAGGNIFMVTLNVQMDPKSVDAPIPYYNWDPISTRWIGLTKNNNQWQIASIATGP
jgi:hypothetical protein